VRIESRQERAQFNSIAAAMLSARALAVLGAVFGFYAFSAADAGLGERAAFDAHGIVGKRYGGEAKAADDYVADFAPGTFFGEKTDNETSPMIKDRSLELVGRQSCNAGYWYCEGMYIILYHAIPSFTFVLLEIYILTSHQHSTAAAQPLPFAAVTAIASTRNERAAQVHLAIRAGAAVAQSAIQRVETAALTTATANPAIFASGSSRAVVSSAVPTLSAPLLLSVEPLHTSPSSKLPHPQSPHHQAQFRSLLPPSSEQTSGTGQ